MSFLFLKGVFLAHHIHISVVYVDKGVWEDGMCIAMLSTITS